MLPQQVSDALAQLDALVGQLLHLPVESVEAADFAGVLAAVETQRHRLDGVDQRLIAAAGRAGLAAWCGQPGLADVLARLLRIDAGEARARVARAADLGPRFALTGQPLPPILSATADAVAAGAVSTGQVQVIIECLDAIAPDAPAGVWPVAERVLLAAAEHESPRELRRTAAELLARLDPDGLEPAETQIERRRGFSLMKHRDGSSSPRGLWTAEVTAQWEAILDSLAAPQPAGDQPDDRTASQRRHDAMGDAALRLLTSATLPANAGVPVTVLATITLSELTAAAAAGSGAVDGPPTPQFCLAELARAAGIDLGSGDGEIDLGRMSPGGLALLGHGQLISAAQLLRIACDAAVIPVVFNDAGGVLAYGRERRLASRGQRLALVARDGGCTFPGCDRPAAWTEVHHIHEWAAGGATDLDNMVLLCRFHHRHFAALGWQVRMSTDGLPDWIPPPWLDHQRRPVRNTVHHRHDFDFRQPVTAA